MDDSNPPAEQYANPLDVAQTLQRVLLYGVLPLWIVPGFLDYLFHRKSKIESTSGTHESMIHAMQMTSAGVPTLMALLCEVNAPVVAAMVGGTLLHEALTLWDIAYAEPLRRPTPNEQHTHSFLEVMPLTAATMLMALHPDQTAAFFGRGDAPRHWRLRLKNPPLSRRYVAAILGIITTFIAVPYAEELWRCYRADHTLAPHQRPADDDPAPEG